MSYLIDGHNLIPKIPGLSLQAADDEQQLIQLLQDFCRRRRKEVEVYFDQAPPGMAGPRRFGAVRAVFVRQGSTADSAIRGRLLQLGREARGYTVVTSDGAVQSSARAAGAQILSSEEFARLLLAEPNRRKTEKPADTHLNEREVDEWLRLFQDRDRKKKDS